MNIDYIQFLFPRIPKDQETSQGKIAYDPVVRKKILFVNLDQAKKLMPGFEEVYNLKNKREPSREFESKIWPSDFLDDRDDGSFNEQLDRERVWPQLNPKIM